MLSIGTTSAGEEYGFKIISSCKRSFTCKKKVISGVLVWLVALLPFVASCSATETSTYQPNIIFVLTDDLDSASAQKMPEVRSKLIEEGTSFENAFVSFPTCCPSRATILTGLYAHNHDVKGNNPPQGGFRTFRSEGLEESTIALRLQEVGYQTAYFGKYMNRYADGDPTHVPPGWDEWYGKLNEQKLYDYRINENGEVASYGSESDDFFTDVLASQATDFVERAASDSRPFFMYVAPTAPHAPATPAKRHEGAFSDEEVPRPPSLNEEDVSDKPSWIRDIDRLSDKQVSSIDRFHQQRLSSMLAVDEMVASLVQELNKAEELDNTFIFFTSDNGFHAGEHRILLGKRTPYEESARVPLFVRGPGVPAESTVEKLTLNTDVAPTLAGLAGVEFLADGHSLAPLLGGDEGTSSWRTAILLETFANEEAEEGPQANLPNYQAVRTETHKYVEYDNGERELYDLQTDPYELKSIHESADPTILEDLKAKLDTLKSCSKEGCREVEDGP
jgi:N-acetylglucosamine-6-sulfatase